MYKAEGAETKQPKKNELVVLQKAVQTSSFFAIIELMKNLNTEVNYGTFTRNVQLLIDESHGILISKTIKL